MNKPLMNMPYHSQRAIYAIMLWTLTTNSACLWVSSTQRGAYFEDLARHRKPLKQEEKKASDSDTTTQKKLVSKDDLKDISSQIDELLAANKQQQISGCTIQVYTGKSRAQALKIKSELYEYYPHLKTKIQYSATNYTVQVGSFLNRNEALEVYVLVKKKIPNAIIRPIILC